MTAADQACTPANVPKEPPRLLLIAAWFAVAVGLAEVSIRAVQKFFLHQFIFTSPHLVWMAPLANLFFFTICGFALSLVGRRRPRLISLSVAAFIFAFLSFAGPLLWYSRLHFYAALLLVIGLAAQTARLIAAHPRQFYALARRTLGWLAILGGRGRQNGRQAEEHGDASGSNGLVSRRWFLLSTGTTFAGLAVGVHGWQELGGWRALANLPPAAFDAPNVLLIVLDTVRAQSLSLYGYARRTTPQLERLAKAGVVFERALSTSPWTLPSHASMFTGRFPYELSADWLTPLDRTYPTLAEAFSARGYVTAGFVANLLYSTYETGLARGFIHYEDYPVSLGMIARSSWLARTITARLHSITGTPQGSVRKTADEVNENFLRWLARKGERPFFAFLNYMDAHAPYLPPKPFDVMFGPKRSRPDPSVRRQWSAQEIQVERDAYDGSIAYLDHQLGLLFDELQKRGWLDNTLVIITSDHGEQFGEHGLFDHANSLYRPLLQVPLLISFPSRVPAGTRVHAPVTLRDMPATIMGLVEFEGGPRFPGNSLAHYWDGVPDPSRPATPVLSEVSKGINMPKWLPVMKGDMTSLVADGRHYIRNGDGREELYNFETDPAEEQDLAGSEEGRRAIEGFRESLEIILASGSSKTDRG